MQAIILAAGLGRRLGELTKENTKCMVKVNGVALIDRLLSQLSQLQLSRVILVIGYKGEKLRRYVGSCYKNLPVEYIENPIYDKTNNIYSLWLAKDALQSEDTLLIESDLIFEDSLFRMAIECPFPNLALVDKYEPWMDGTMVCLDEENNILNFVPKKLFRYEDVGIYYKTVNIYKFSKEFSRTQYIPFLEAYTKALGNNEYYEQVLRVITMLDRCELKALPLNGQKWYEIDDIQDLDIAEAMFSHGEERLTKMQKRYGGYWRFPGILDFCYLVNPYFPSERLKKEFRANFDTLLSEYPSGMSVNALLAGKYFNVRESFVCVGNGAAELIKSLMSLIEGKIGVIYPTFEEYPNRCEENRLVRYIPKNQDFSYSVADLESYFEGKELAALLLINPDNPSGNFIPKEQVLEFCSWLEGRGVKLVLDESFVDFSTESYANTLLNNAILQSHPNLIVIKSISKSYGVPGLRLGVAATQDEDFVKRMRQDVAIWNINSFAEYYMQIFSKYEGEYKTACRLFIEERARFFTLLQQVPFLRVIPSQANYFLCEVKGCTSKELTLKLLDKNILIKDCGTKAAFTDSNYVRIAVRNKNDNDKLINILKSMADEIH